MHFFVTGILLAASSVAAAPATCYTNDVTQFSAEHTPHSSTSTVKFNVAPEGSSKTVHCEHTAVSHFANDLAVFSTPVACAAAPYEFTFTRNAQKDYVLTVIDTQKNLRGTKTFGMGKFFATEGGFTWEYIDSVGHFSVTME